MTRESRLIGYTLDQLKTMQQSAKVTPTATQYNGRIAQANADQQAAQHQTQVQVNQSTGQTVGSGMKMAEPTQIVGGLLDVANTVYNRPTGQTTVYQPGANGQVGVAANIDQGQIALNAYNRLVNSGMDPDQAAAKLNSDGYNMGVRSAFTAAQPGIIDTSGLKPLNTAGVQETPQDFAARKASIEQQNAALMAQQTQKQIQARNKAASNAASAAAGANQQFSSVEDLVDHYRKQGTDEQTIRGLVDQYNQQKAPSPEQQGQAAGIESLIATLTPEQRQYLEPMLRAQMQDINQSNALAGATFGNDMKAAKDNFETTNTQLQAAADMNVKLQKDLDEISQQMRDSSLENIAKQQKVNEDRLQWEQTKRERDLKNEERKAVDRKIGEMALIGGFGSYASGQIVDEVRNNFESAISDLSIEFGLQRSESAVRFSAQHNDVMNQYRADSINSLSALTAKLEQIGGQFASNKIAKTNAEKSAWDTFVKTHTENADKASAKLESYTKDIFGIINQERDDKRAQEQLGWQRLDWAVKTYGTFTPKAILESIGKQLPGVDVAQLSQNMTLAQMKQFKIKSMGGSAGGGSSGALSYVGSSPQGVALSDISPAQLREAVDRVTLNFGGTGEERNRKRNEYLNRIASGENTASIMTSMQNDYWASQKGAPRTAHDGRTEAQASAESLQSFVDFYSIGENDDGPLGNIDSRVQGVMAIFGQSSEEYNNLANNVGNIRARIIKENYGAAVTPQELAVAKSYIPDMTDKGNVFTTKLQNLKAYNAYLDAKVFASNVGLPAPKPPKPITTSGPSMSGPGKYSDADINSFLSQ